MKFLSTTLIISAVSAVAFGIPQRGGGGGGGRPTRTVSAPAPPASSTTSTPSSPGTPAPAATCLTSTDAQNLVTGFASLLTAYTNATAEALLAGDFSDTSDSINFLAGNPLGSTTFPSKGAFEAGQGSQPPIGFQVLNIDAVTCTVIAFRWEATIGPQTPVKGINILYAENNSGAADGWQIKTVFSEFNSGLWSQEVGGVCAS